MSAAIPGSLTAGIAGAKRRSSGAVSQFEIQAVAHPIFEVHQPSRHTVEEVKPFSNGFFKAGKTRTAFFILNKG